MTTATAPERRFISIQQAKVETRAGADGTQQRVLSGYAAVFYDPKDPGTEFELYPGYVERIMPGAFDQALKNDDVRCLFNHDPSWILGRTSQQKPTARLSVDARGLKFECDLPPTEQGNTVATAVDRGDVSGCSFAMDVLERVLRETQWLMIREVISVKLYDVGPVTFPAYESTQVALRSRDRLQAEVDQLHRQQRAKTLRTLQLKAK